MKIYIKSTSDAGKPVNIDLKSYLKGPADLAAHLLIDRVTKEAISDNDLSEAVNSIDIAMQVVDAISNKIGVTPKIYSPSGNKIEIVNLPGTVYTVVNSEDIESLSNDWISEFKKFFKNNYKSTISNKGIISPNKYIDNMTDYISNNVYNIDYESKLHKNIKDSIIHIYTRNK